MTKIKNDEFKNTLKEAYSDNNEKALDELQSYYSFGHCMDLAIAFHRLYGFEIQVMLVSEDTGYWIGHAWVKRPSGDYLDVLGSYTDTIEFESFGDKKLTNLIEADLHKYIDTSTQLDDDIEKAKLLAECILKNLNSSK
jgi:hypothetical protein